MTDYIFAFYFTSLKKGKAGITATVKVERRSSAALVVNGNPTIPSANLPGWHWFVMLGQPDDDYGAVATTPDITVDAQDVPAFAQNVIWANPINVNAELSAIHGAGPWTSKLAGAGSKQWIYTLTNASTGAPIPNAQIWASTDIAGLNRIAYDLTNEFGQVTFYLDPGTYYIWRTCPGFKFSDPDTEVVPI